MSRTVKAPAVRRAEILEIANMLFRRLGYSNTSVEEIVREAGVAKGTFYYYFRTKEAVLEALATQLVEAMAERSRSIASDQKLGPVEKFQSIFAELSRLANSNAGVVEDLHSSVNRELHDRSNVETVRVLGPIFAGIVEEGREAGVFNVKDALSTVQFIMAGSLFLFGEGIFNWTQKEKAARLYAMRELIARALGMSEAVMSASARSAAQGDAKEHRDKSRKLRKRR